MSLNLFVGTQGRIGRLKYLGAFATLVVASAVFWLVLVALDSAEIDEGDPIIGLARFVFVGWVLFLAVSIFSLAAKRWHDIGRSGWMSLLFLVPFVGYVVLASLFFWPGQRTENKYGEPQ